MIYKLNHENESLSIVKLKSLISQKNVIGLSPKYNNTEIAILFDYYKQFIDQINEKQRYIPTKGDFCSFVGISTTQYDNWKQSDDTERREIMQMIDDYIVDLNLTSAQNGDIKEISTMFRGKVEHGLVEAQAPIVIQHKSQANLEDIRKQIEAVNQGKSLKTIELKKQPDGSYANEE